MVEGVGALLALIAVCWIVLSLAGLATARGKDAGAHLIVSVLLLGGGLACWRLAMWITGW